MISKKDLITRGRNNPYGLTQKQLDELEVTKEQVAKHLKNVDFSKYTQNNSIEVERQASRVLAFSTLLKDRRSNK
jgi:hypothetical protein